MTYAPSAAGVALIKKWEGCERREPDGRLAAYRCPEGVPTIGWGSTENVKMGMVITPAEAELMLTVKLAQLGAELARRVKRPLEQHQVDALISFGFNCGFGGAPTLFKLLNAGRFNLVSAQLLRFVHGANSGNVLPGLVARRHDEALMFATASTATLNIPAPVAGELMPRAVRPRKGSIAPALTGSRTVWGALGTAAAAVAHYIGVVPSFLSGALEGGQQALAPLQPFLEQAGMSSPHEWFLLTIVVGVGVVIYARLDAAREEKIG